METTLSIPRIGTPLRDHGRPSHAELDNARMLVDVMPTLSLAEWDVALASVAEWGEVVRETADRTVYRILCSDGEVYAKHFHPRRLSAKVRLLTKRPHRLEYSTALKAVSREIPTAVPLLQRESPKTVEALCVTQGIPDSVPLSMLCDDEGVRFRPKGVREIASLIDSAAGFLAQIHAEGLRHDDFHAGNVLLSRPGRSQYAFHLIDFASAAFCARIPWKRARRDLIVWNARWRELVSPRMRERFLGGYLYGRIERDPQFGGEVERMLGTSIADIPATRRAVRKCLEEIDLESIAYSRKVDARRDRRAWRDNRDFRRRETFSGSVHYRVEFKLDIERNLFKASDEDRDLQTEKTVKASSSSSVAKLQLPTENGKRSFAFKRFLNGRRWWWKTLLSAFRRTRGAKAWYYGNAMHVRGIPTAKPLCVLECRIGPFVIASSALTEWLEGAIDLHGWLRKVESLEEPDRHRRLLDAAKTLGRLVGRMHSRGVSHGDLKAANILVKDDGGRIEPYFIDVDGAQVSGESGIPLRRRVRDLARLGESASAYPWISRSVCLGFFRAYAEAIHPEGHDWKRLWRLAAARAQRRIGKKRARGKAVL